MGLAGMAKLASRHQRAKREANHGNMSQPQPLPDATGAVPSRTAFLLLRSGCRCAACLAR